MTMFVLATVVGSVEDTETLKQEAYESSHYGCRHNFKLL